ncbi:MAG: hypothetical protein RIQ93_1394 [Verrucomicrobiota bacterium]|jgi:cyclophilin family peptidyl-prolyl cis-trans isomerase
MTLPRFSSLFLLLALALTTALPAQSTSPAVGRTLASQTLATGGAPLTIDLRDYFLLPGVSGQIAQFETVLGAFNVELRSESAPLHVANFLSYVQAGAYGNTFFHRSAYFAAGNLSSIVQGGGYRGPLANLSPILPFSPVPLEYALPNARGTLAAARTSEINSAKSEWYFNVADNTTTLGPGNNGGYTVFGRVLGSGMTIVDAIAALPRANAGAPFGELPVRNFVGGGAAILDANLVYVLSIKIVPQYPDGVDAGVLALTAQSSAPAIVSAAVSGSALALTPRAAGSANVTVRATDTNGGVAEATFLVSVVGGPVFTTQPVAQFVNASGAVTLAAAASGASSYQWQRNGVAVAGATGATLTIASVQPADAGVYEALASNGSVTTSSQRATVGVATGNKFVGAAKEFPDIIHANGNVYDQLLLEGAAITLTADPGQIVRASYLDLNDDIVQVEFSGDGTVSIALENATGPGLPAKYNQGTLYMRGRASVVISGANENSHVSIFSVGRGTAFNQALFRDEVVYDGMADLAALSITSTNGRFGSVRTANVRYSSATGITGVYAPGVTIDGPLFIGDIAASGTATPVILVGGAGDPRITGGDLLQLNAQAVQVDGLTRVQMTAGTNSHRVAQPAQPLRGRLERNGVDVTAQLVP